MRNWRKLVLLPTFGIHALVGQSGDRRGSGASFGGLVGFRPWEFFSFNGQLTFGFPNVKNRAPSSEPEIEALISFSPLGHFSAGPAQFVFGPRLGLWVASAGDQDELERRDSGFALGLNSGVFFRLGQTFSIGGLIGFDVRSYEEQCLVFRGREETCVKTGLPDALKTLEFSTAVLF
jgi:hypothetical protein